MPVLPCDAGRDAPPRLGRGQRRRPHGWRQGPQQGGLRARRQQAANLGTRRPGYGPGASRYQAGIPRRPRLGRLAAPRPPTSASRRRRLSSPWPCSRPDQPDSITEQRRSQGPGQSGRTRPTRPAPAVRRIPLAAPGALAASKTSRVDRRSLARAESRLASVGRTGVCGARQTRSTVSSKVVTTFCQRPSDPGRGTRTRRSRSAPISTAATRPSSGRPTTAHQQPCDEAPASSKSSRLVSPGAGSTRPREAPEAETDPSVSAGAGGPSRTVPPLGRPLPGNSPASSAETGRVRSGGGGTATERERDFGAVTAWAEKALGTEGVPARA